MHVLTRTSPRRHTTWPSRSASRPSCTYTGGEKLVQGAGDTLTALLDDLDSRHSGLRGRLVTDEGNLHRFVNVYVNDEDVRFLGGLETKLADGDNVTVLPAVAGG